VVERLGENWCGTWHYLLVVRRKLGDRKSISFWHDRWVGRFPLKDVFLRLFSVSVVKEASTADIGVNGHLVWSWR